MNTTFSIPYETYLKFFVLSCFLHGDDAFLLTLRLFGNKSYAIKEAFKEIAFKSLRTQMPVSNSEEVTKYLVGKFASASLFFFPACCLALFARVWRTLQQLEEQLYALTVLHVQSKETLQLRKGENLLHILFPAFTAFAIIPFFNRFYNTLHYFEHTAALLESLEDRDFEACALLLLGS
jgi:hypothetical protein